MSERLSDRRKKLNLTQRQIAEGIGVTVQSVSNWETGLNQPKLTAEQFQKLCQILQIDLEHLTLMLSSEEVASSEVSSDASDRRSETTTAS